MQGNAWKKEITERLQALFRRKADEDCAAAAERGAKLCRKIGRWQR